MRNLIAVGMLAALVVGCERAGPVEEPAASVAAVELTGPQCVTLWAGQHDDVGEVCVWSDGVYLYFDYSLDGPEWFEEIHTWVGTTNQYPGYPGSPSPGQISKGPTGDNSGQLPEGTRSYQVRFPLSAIGATCGDWIYLLAHAALSSGETAWGEGDPAPGSNWAMIGHVQIYCDDTPDPEPRCETAFARIGTANDATCFGDVDEDISRWGWTNYLTSALPGPIPLYAGAAHCLYQGAPVAGHVTVTCDASDKLDVSFEAAAGWTFTETQLYVGETSLPTVGKKGRTAVAPGQYPWSSASGEYTDVYNCGELPAYLIAHAVACPAVMAPEEPCDEDDEDEDEYPGPQ